jgi:hypothetical protein
MVAQGQFTAQQHHTAAQSHQPGVEECADTSATAIQRRRNEAAGAGLR